MWRSAFVGLLVAVVVIALWNSAHADTGADAKISALQTRVTDLGLRSFPYPAPADGYLSGDFANIAAPYQWRQYCRITQLGPSYVGEYTLDCIRISFDSTADGP